MAWTNPVVPVTLTTITTAWAKQTIVDNLAWLRALTGGADPPGSGYLIISGGPISAAWGKVSTDNVVDGSITDAKLATQKVTRTGDTMSGDLVITRSGATQPTVGYLILGNNSANYFGFDGSKHVLQTPRLNVTGDVYVYRNATPTTGYVILGSDSAHFVGFNGTDIVADASPIWTDANTTNRVTRGKILDGEVITAKIPDLAITTLKLADLAVTAIKLAANAVTRTKILDGEVITAKLADLGVTTAKLADGAVTTPKLAASVPIVPSGLIAAFPNAAAIASGWTRFTSANGMFLVGAGTSYGQSFSEGASVGSTWDHQHGGAGLSTSAASGGGSVQGGGSSSADPQGHTHPMGGSTANTRWLPPSFTVVWAQKT